MKTILLFTICFSTGVFSQTYKDSIIELRIIHTGELIDTSTHILSLEEIADFQGLAYFDVDSNLLVKNLKCQHQRIENPFIEDLGMLSFILDLKNKRLQFIKIWPYADKRNIKIIYLFRLETLQVTMKRMVAVGI